MNKLVLSNEKVLDILPYFAEIGEKLEKEIKEALENKDKGSYFFIMAILKNIKKVKKELYLIVSEVTGKPIDEVKAMNIILTIGLFKQILSSEGIKELINFTAEQSSTN